MLDRMYNGYIDEPEYSEHEQDDESSVYDRVNQIKDEAAQSGKYFPTCPYCRKQQLPLAAYTSQMAADEYAALHCDCVGAVDYQAGIKRQQERDNNIKKLHLTLSEYSEYCRARAVDLSGALYDYLVTCGTAVIDGVIGSASVTYCRMKMTFTINGKNNLVVGFSYSDGTKKEIKTGG